MTMQDKLMARANWLINHQKFGLEHTAQILNLEYPISAWYFNGEIRWSHKPREEGRYQILDLPRLGVAQ